MCAELEGSLGVRCFCIVPDAELVLQGSFLNATFACLGLVFVIWICRDLTGCVSCKILTCLIIPIK